MAYNQGDSTPPRMYIIRLACMNDLERVEAIVRCATQSMDEQSILQWDSIYLSRSILQTDIENHHLYVIESVGASWVVAGLIVLNEKESPEYGAVSWEYPGRVLVVHRLTIDPEYQGKKLASKLMDFAEREAAFRGYNTIRLDAFTQNLKAAALYDRRGCRKAGTVRFRKGLFFCYEKRVS